MLTPRQEKILNLIIKQHIKTAEPIGSNFLVEKAGLKVSPATVRNEMLDLDQKGYLIQPHTSAGRVPSEKGYNYYLKKNKSIKPKSRIKKKIRKQFLEDSKNTREGYKSLSKALSEITQQFVLTALAENDFYYTGLSFLFSKPEFSNQQFLINISEVIDHLDTQLQVLFRTTKTNQPQAMIGADNPIDVNLSLLVLKSSVGPLVAILGPMRMRYCRNFGLLEYCSDLLTS